MYKWEGKKGWNFCIIGSQEGTKGKQRLSEMANTEAHLTSNRWGLAKVLLMWEVKGRITNMGQR